MSQRTPTPYRKPEHLKLVLHYIENYRAEHGFSPSNREVAEAFPTASGYDRSTAVVRYWFRCMEREGMIEYNPHIARGIVPTME